MKAVTLREYLQRYPQGLGIGGAVSLLLAGIAHPVAVISLRQKIKYSKGGNVESVCGITLCRWVW